MRITCPDCEARYEVPDEVIPDEGRDVQCSNCGTTWLFIRAGDDEGAQLHDDDDGLSPQTDENDEAAEQSFVAAAPRRDLDPKVASILRAEAERESAARAADARPGPLEMQPELGLTEGATARRRPREDRGAKLAQASVKPVPTPPDPDQTGNMTIAAATAAGSRRDLLPDIEEINSTLRSDGTRNKPRDELVTDPPDRTQGRRGFRLGLVIAVLIFALCAVVYQFAPRIAEAVPQADPWLSSYVTWVDEMRIALDVKVRQALDWLDAQAAASGE